MLWTGNDPTVAKSTDKEITILVWLYLFSCISLRCTPMLYGSVTTLY